MGSCDPHKGHREDDRATQGLGYLRPLPGSGTRSTVVVAGRRRASSTGIKVPVRASRPRGVVSAGFWDGFFDDMIRFALKLEN